MSSPLFESMIENNMTLLADDPAEDSPMMLSAADIHASGEGHEEPKFRLDSTTRM